MKGDERYDRYVNVLRKIGVNEKGRTLLEIVPINLLHRKFKNEKYLYIEILCQGKTLQLMRGCPDPKHSYARLDDEYLGGLIKGYSKRDYKWIELRALSQVTEFYYKMGFHYGSPRFAKKYVQKDPENGLFMFYKLKKKPIPAPTRRSNRLLEKQKVQKII